MTQANDTPAEGAGNGHVAVHLEPTGHTVSVLPGTTLEDAITKAGVRVSLPCGGQGRCGRCAVQVTQGEVRRRSTIRLTQEEVDNGYALACQTLVTGDATVWVPPEQERLERMASGDLAEDASIDSVLCDHHAPPWVARYAVGVDPPSLADNTPDFERLQRELTRQCGLRNVSPSLTALAKLPQVLRDGGWTVTAEIEQRPPEGAECGGETGLRLVDVLPGRSSEAPLGLAIDIGTTTVVTYLADLATGRSVDGMSAYNEQIGRGEDVVSRIIYAKDAKRLQELQNRVVTTINELVDAMLALQHRKPEDIGAVVVAGNTTMTHLFLGIEPAYIRLEPYVGAAGIFPPVPASRLGLHVHPEALVDCLPAVGAYVGGDITAGVIRSGMHHEEPVTLFIDIGTNGEMVLGNSEWLISCACSAGPAFEGAGATSGMRASRGAVEEVWIDPGTLEPSVTTIGSDVARGICGSGMISLLGEMMLTGVIDKSGRVAMDAPSDRVRQGHSGGEYVVVWAGETATGEHDIVLTEADIQNLMRAKAAIYAGAAVLCESVGLSITDVERVLIGGSFGRHIDVEKAILIGLMPDLPWDRFSYLGNTSLQGAYLAMTCREHRAQIDEIAGKMTYLELSADNRFMDAFTSALFLPHTDESLFPSVQKSLAEVRRQGALAR